ITPEAARDSRRLQPRLGGHAYVPASGRELTVSGRSFLMYEENKSIVREFFEKVVNAGYLEHQELPGGEDRQGIEVAKGFLSLMRGAFPDFRFEIEDLIAEGDKVAARVSVSGTHLQRYP